MENNIENNPSEVKENVVNNNSKKTIASALVVMGVLLVGVFLLKGTTPPIETADNDSENIYDSIVIKPIEVDEHIYGNPEAEIMIVEYSDTECPFCKNFHTTMHNIVEESNGEVAWVYRHYPIAQLHPKAFHEAEATECASELGGNDAFWKYTDQVYLRTQSNDSLDVAELPKIAQDLGLDMSAFNTCLASGKFAEKIQADMLDGENAGVQGTPTSFIVKDDVVVDIIQGAQPIDIVMEKINNL